MNPDNKKPRSGQLQGKDGYLSGGNNGRYSRSQYNPAPGDNQPFNTEAHLRATRRAMGDAYVMLSCWPACMRYSYFVGPDGKLITRGERRAGAS
jgi:hypothetical protein